jgi:CRP-like cAMP-binding protein
VNSVVSSSIHRVGNRLLAGLPAPDQRRILRSCETVHLVVAELLYSAGDVPDHIYFPISGFISLIVPSADSTAFEVGLVGNEGLLGTAAALNGEVSAERATVQGGGSALRMDAAALRRELRRNGALRNGVDRYVHVRMDQLAQAAICARFHLLEARVACRLLTTEDRAQANTFTITQDLLASKLGVRRAGVTNAANSLKRRRMIRYSRGDVTVLDRRALMSASCSCYKADRAAHARAFGTTLPPP